MMLANVRGLLTFAAGHQQRTLQAFAAFSSTMSRDVADANQELDDFFGVRGSSHLSAHGLRDVPSSQDGSSIPTFSEVSPGRPGGVNTSDSGTSISGTYGTGSVSFAAHAAGHETARGLGPHRQQQQLQERKLTHIDASGSAAMVDVSQKAVTVREAQASCAVMLGAAYEAVAANSVAKGDVLKVAQLAGISGAKATASLIPLCHNIPISKVDVQLHLDEPNRSVVVRALARADGKTGVEMEALTAATVAALTVYDMCKAAAKDMVVGQLQLDYKSGGRGGTYLRAGLRRADLLPSARPPL